jgi:hypothetical protein
MTDDFDAIIFKDEEDAKTSKHLHGANAHPLHKQSHRCRPEDKLLAAAHDVVVSQQQQSAAPMQATHPRRRSQHLQHHNRNPNFNQLLNQLSFSSQQSTNEVREYSMENMRATSNCEREGIEDDVVLFRSGDSAVMEAVDEHMDERDATE